MIFRVAVKFSTCDNKQRETRHEEPNPRRTGQPLEEHETLRRKNGNDGGEQESPMLEESLQTVALAMRVHTYIK